MTSHPDHSAIISLESNVGVTQQKLGTSMCPKKTCRVTIFWP